MATFVDDIEGTITSGTSETKASVQYSERIPLVGPVSVAPASPNNSIDIRILKGG
jgi:hypothetical protein